MLIIILIDRWISISDLHKFFATFRPKINGKESVSIEDEKKWPFPLILVVLFRFRSRLWFRRTFGVRSRLRSSFSFFDDQFCSFNLLSRCFVLVDSFVDLHIGSQISRPLHSHRRAKCEKKFFWERKKHFEILTFFFSWSIFSISSLLFWSFSFRSVFLVKPSNFPMKNGRGDPSKKFFSNRILWWKLSFWSKTFLKINFSLFFRSTAKFTLVQLTRRV